MTDNINVFAKSGPGKPNSYAQQPNGRTIPDTWPRFLRTRDAGFYLGISPRTLEKHRTYGTGPVFRKLGHAVVYAVQDLDAWAKYGTRRSTSDPGAGITHPAKPLPSQN